MMLHPSYTDLMDVVNSGVEYGEAPVVASRYSIVMATAKRARQIIAVQAASDAARRERMNGAENARHREVKCNYVPPLVSTRQGKYSKKPLSIAVEELEQGKMRIISKDNSEE